MPDALNCGVGPQPRGPLYVPDSLNTREGPQAMEPSKCLISTTRKKQKKTKKTTVSDTNTWRLNNRFINNQQDTE